VGGGVFSGAVSFACANLPALTSCSFSPTSIAAGAGTTAVTVTISTTGPISGSGSDRRRSRSGRYIAGSAKRGGIGIAWTLTVTIPMAGLFLWGIGLGRTDRRGTTLGWCVAFAGLLVLVSCGGLGGGGGGQGPPAVTVTVSPGSANVYADEAGNTWPASATQEQFSAVVNNGSSQSVTWAVTGGSANGTIDANGLYTSPSVAPNPASATVTATSSQATAPGSATVNIKTATAVGTYSNVQVSATAAGGAGHADVVTLTVD
jgi:hypothetical protein